METNTVIHGDCSDVMEDMPDESVDLVVTDPPYGIDFQSSHRTESFDKIEGDNEINTSFLPEVFRLLKSNSDLYLFTRWDVYPEWYSAVNDAGFEVKNCLVWEKNNAGMGDLHGSYAPKHEWIIYATKGKTVLRGGRSPDVLQYPTPDVNEYEHPTQKPVSLVRHLIKKSSLEGQTVLDPFAGSGTTCVAAKQLGRTYIGVEMKEKYVAVAQKRLKNQSERLSTFIS